mgnify:CR=1 FL=1
MKNLLTLVSFTCFTIFGYSQNAKETMVDYEKRNPIYDYSESQLNNTDTIPGFQTATNKLKITGIIYESDGVTPAKDAILFIEQADETGDYQIRENNNKRFMSHRGWVKTNANGEYTFYTFVPGAAISPVTFPRRKGLKKILPTIKENNKPEYYLNAFLFDNDPLLTKACRKRLKRKGIDSILKPTKQGDILVVNKDIVLEENTLALNK